MVQKRSMRKTEHRPISSLQPHDLQASVFGDLSEVELRDLADDIERNGLQTPVEILSDGTIICGHQRVRAHKLLGKQEIACWVRDDLEQQGDAAVECRLIDDNLHRRQLSKLAIARCYQMLKKVALENGYDGDDANEDLRDHLAKRFGLSGKQVERYVRMLDAPFVVQQAFDAGKLRQKEVLAVVALDADEQQQIAQQIEEGLTPKDVVKSHVTDQQATEVGVVTAVYRLVRALETAETQISDRIDELPGRRLEFQLGELLTGARFVQKLHGELTKKIEAEESENWSDDES